MGAADATLLAYFLRLARFGGELLDRLALEAEPQPLGYALERIAQELARGTTEAIAAIAALERPGTDRTASNEPGVGLNSIGMLADRFTILMVKEWCLRNKSRRDADAADRLFQEQTMDIIEALCRARPGNSAMNSKITVRRAEAAARSWAEAFYGLLSVNIVLWEAQEILYIRDIAQLPADDLRAYIRWFSTGNIERNEYIQLCEERYWAEAV